MKNEYGLQARVDIPRKTMLGYYEGVLVKRNRIMPYNDYVLETYDDECVDASAHLAGYGRYMNCAKLPQDQNVSFEMVESRQVNKRVIMVTTVDIARGSELFTQYGAPYWLDKLERLPLHDAKGRRGVKDMLKTAKLKSSHPEVWKHNNCITYLEAQEMKDKCEGGASEDEDDAADLDYIEK